MAKYNVTHSCGHTERVDLIGPHRSREWRLDRMAEKPCDACWRAERDKANAEANAKAAAENKAMELPALTGTDKQIAWAETVRLRLLRAIDETLASERYQSIAKHPRLAEVLEGLYAEHRAGWWIDQRNEVPICLLSSRLEEPSRASTSGVGDSAAKLEAEAEATVQPVATITTTAAEIRTVGKDVQIVFPEKREAFRELMHDLHYRWADAHWERKIGQFNGTVEDRAAEAGHRLLAAGFPIRMYDEQLRARAIAGEFTPEPERWVTKCLVEPYKDWFSIQWPRGEDNFYAAAKRLPRSRYSKGRVYVPAEKYEEVMDFAESFGFNVSPGAAELAEAATAAQKAVLKVDVKPAEPEPLPEAPGRLPPMLDVPEEVAIANELRDD